MDKRKVLVIAADLNPKDLGGAEIHLVETIKLLAREYDFTVLVGKETTIRNFWPKNVKVIPVNYPQISNFRSPLFIFWSTFTAVKLTSREKFFLVWAKQEFPQGLVAAALAVLRKIPVYVTAQNPQAYKEELVITGSLAIGRPIINIFSELALREVLRKSTVVGAVSSYSAILAKKFGAKKVLLVPNGVDLEFFKPNRRQKKNFQEVTIVTTSTLIPRNGIDIAISGLAQLPKKVDWQFLIAGEGPEKENLTALADKLGVADRIHYLGTLDSQGVRGLLEKADIFLRPSRFEGFGVSFLEAMAMKIPVVTTHSGGQKDFIIDHKTGLVVPIDDPEVVSQAVSLLVYDLKLRQAIIQAAAELVKKKYGWKKISGQIDQIFQEIPR